jgi:hypothetical protein
MNHTQQFVNSYSTAEDRQRIVFAWNGKHAEEFHDANDEFRQQVLALVLADPAVVPIELVRDLFDAETAMAKEAWGVNTEAVRALTRELLTRGGPAFVEDFLIGKIGRGMDAYCAAYFDCPRELAEKLLAEVERRLADAEGQRRALLETGTRIFRDWIVRTTDR